MSAAGLSLRSSRARGRAARTRTERQRDAARLPFPRQQGFCAALCARQYLPRVHIAELIPARAHEGAPAALLAPGSGMPAVCAHVPPSSPSSSSPASLSKACGGDAENEGQ